MDSAQYAIDNDDTFYLENLPQLDLLLETGVTVFVNEIFPKYHDMTLIQYAIAKRSPQTLKIMLNRLKNVQHDEIMYPTTSNTRGSLLNLAVEFGTKNNFYKDDNNDCLNVIIDFFKDYIKQDFKCLQAPINQSLRSKNKEAAKSLIGVEEDFFYPLPNDQNDISENDLAKMTAMSIFAETNDEEQLTEFFDVILGEQKDYILDRIFKLKISGRTFLEYLGDNNFTEAKGFLDKRKQFSSERINIVDDTPSGSQNPEQGHSKPAKTNTRKSSERKCAKNNAHSGPLERCQDCGKYYCAECMYDHDCT